MMPRGFASRFSSVRVAWVRGFSLIGPSRRLHVDYREHRVPALDERLPSHAETASLSALLDCSVASDFGAVGMSRRTWQIVIWTLMEYYVILLFLFFLGVSLGARKLEHAWRS
ncbi:hypothetical protein MPTK1_2g09530 [Marchantia polymorpha subsp. ruderalis]|uniref:Uncharacterized protein n=1 Tax=Marchantia polymorpha TaxID=3197 RepID=A0A2R6W455_MARPO|nr:hypothetical protein MARPO_0158s0024 [Marchantia polymorpha]BBN01693.1 hypothetical protein Mp_2g09530 [Marchantia polymorpha subsp. ruderalis]|eukprot:PTQ28646.1 hypothetical protein MARPO_0158s0024 [Marchantia polymorpha]